MEKPRRRLRRTLNPRTKFMNMSLTPEVHAEVVKCAAAVDLAPTTLAAVLVERAVKGEYDRIRRRQRRAAAAAGADE